jgi:hypothetical protein
MNGALFQITAWLQWVAAGGALVGYDVAFSTTVGGYQNGALLKSATAGHYWYSTADNNATNPDAGGSGWTMFPDALIQIQGGNFAYDSGAANAVVITLSPAPASLASIKGSPIRFVANHANTINNPTIAINGFSALTMINSNGNPLSVGQISRAGQIVEGYSDGTYFQITSPGPLSTPSSGLQSGMVIINPKPNGIPFTGTLECDGSLQLIASYPNLFNAISNGYGGDGVTTFTLPDYRGEVLRGWDHGRGLDPNASTRTNRGDGTTGDHVGTNQLGEAGPITMTGVAFVLNNPMVGNPTNPAPYPTLLNPSPLALGGDSGFDPVSLLAGVYVSGPYTLPFNVWGTLSGTANISGSSGAETRPVNIYVQYVIVY